MAAAAAVSQVSSSNIESLKLNKKSFKKVGKSKTLPASAQLANKKSKANAISADNNDDMDVVLTSTLKEIQKTLENPVQVSAPQDPNKPLWDMLKNIALAPDDRIAVGMHLCKLEFQVNRSFLINMGQEYLERWVYKYLSGDDPAGNH